jgi:hypothetical protein
MTTASQPSRGVSQRNENPEQQDGDGNNKGGRDRDDPAESGSAL